MERFDPELKEKYPQLYYEHIHRYLVAREHINGGRVLDLACGEGYGTAILAQKAEQVIGIDKDREAVERATSKYANASLRFQTGDCLQTKLESNSFDYIVSFETIEHLDSPTDFVRELKRLLKPEGLLFISSPDKREYTEVNKISNPHHLNELYHEEFKELLSTQFANCHFSKQRLVAGSLIHADLPAGNTIGIYNENDFTQNFPQGLYSFAICTNSTLPSIKLGLFENKAHSDFSWDAIERFRPTLALLCEKQKELRSHQPSPSVESLLKAVSDIELQNETAQQLLVEKEKQIADLHAAIERLQNESDLKSNELTLSQSQTEQLQKAVDSLTSEKLTLEKERNNFRERYENLLSSFSWKVTVPLRSLRRALQRLRSK